MGRRAGEGVWGGVGGWGVGDTEPLVHAVDALGDDHVPHPPTPTHPPTHPHPLPACRDAEAKVLADLALLKSARNRGLAGSEDATGGGEASAAASDEGDAAAAAEWRPPEGQRGDGRTKLNDLLGY